jgi:hypothetical protein
MAPLSAVLWFFPRFANRAFLLRNGVGDSVITLPIYLEADAFRKEPDDGLAHSVNIN